MSRESNEIFTENANININSKLLLLSCFESASF